MDPNLQTTQPATPQSPPPPPPPASSMDNLPNTSPPPRHIPKVAVMIILVLILVALSLGGINIYKNLSGSNQVMTPTPTIPIQSSPTPTTDPTAEWKMFTSKAYNYSFKYPAGYIVSAESVFNNTDPSQLDRVYLTKSDGVDYHTSPALAIFVKDKETLEKFSNPSILSLEEFAQDNYKRSINKVLSSVTPYPTNVDSNIVNTTTIDQKPAYTYQLIGTSWRNENSLYEGTYTVIDTEHNEVFISILIFDDPILNQILSTFRFLDKNESEIPTTPLSVESGGNRVSWEHAVEQIQNCNVTEVFQSHGLDVMLNLKDGSQVSTKEPRIDEVQSVVNNAVPKCGQIGLSTE